MEANALTTTARGHPRYKAEINEVGDELEKQDFARKTQLTCYLFSTFSLCAALPSELSETTGDLRILRSDHK